MRLLISLIFIFSSSVIVASENLCPPLEPLAGGADDYRMTENDYSLKSSQWSIEWLEDDIWKVIKSNEKTQELLHSAEQFSIPLSNSVSSMKGTIYKLNAQLQQKNFELIKLKALSSSVRKEQVFLAKKQYEDAKDAFCKFILNEENVD